MSSYYELPLTGVEPKLSEEEQAVLDVIHRFAVQVMREAGTAVDRMAPEEVYAQGSIFWDVLEKADGLGLDLAEMAEMDPVARDRILVMACEELGWGDLGLAAAILVNAFPVMYSLLAENQQMVEFSNGKLGCWAITEPDHGSDMLDAYGTLQARGGKYGRPNCIARIEGEKIVINGQKSAWVSGAMTAEVAALYCLAEADGEVQSGISVVVPLDAEGVSRGKPLDKIGMRGCNQGEIFFDNVEVPLAHLLAGPDTYDEFVYRTLAMANPLVGSMWIGVGRAAYEHALAYAHQRRQGGVPIIEHPHVRYRLFHMFRKLEAARALIRRVIEYNATAARPALHGSIAAKVTATQSTFEIASDALQIFGGNGVTKEYPMEKLLRDARSGLIADGCNEILALKGGAMLRNPDLV